MLAPQAGRPYRSHPCERFWPDGLMGQNVCHTPHHCSVWSVLEHRSRVAYNTLGALVNRRMR